MLTIADGRKSFYQWDIGQGLTVTPGEGETITEVHIGLNGCKKYFVVEPVDGIVAVYDELLQQGDTFLVAYEYVKTADDGHTINKYVFKIIGRPKATDYAYTPTESHSWEWWCNQAKSYADAAAESANQAETAAVSADASADRAEAKADSIKNMTVSAHAEEGTEPTVTKTEEGGTFNLDFGLVRGEEGPEGPQGEPGPKGEDGRVTFEDVEPLLITDTASGAIASFPDGSGLDFISLKANIDPIQDLHGYDHPWVGGAGANKWDEEWEVGAFNYTTGEKAPNSAMIRSKNMIEVVSSESYYVLFPHTSVVSGFAILLYYDADGQYLSYTNVLSNGQRVTIPSDARYMMFTVSSLYGTTYNHDIAINYPSTVTTYSPYENICPISGWDSVEASATGVNQWDEEWEAGTYLNTNGTKYNSTTKIRNVNPINVRPNNSYYWYVGTTATDEDSIFCYDKDMNFIRRISVSHGTSIGYMFTTPQNCEFINFAIRNTTYNNDISINYPSTDTEYHAYNGHTHTATFDETVYGGTVDLVSGVLNKKPYYASYNGETLTGEWISDRDEYAAGTTPTIGAQVVNIGADGTDIQLSPQAINTLVGVNNVWADSGDSEVEYYANAKLYIDKKLGELS